ncbi:hypothetical protein AGOR_G00092140 [Albula goreensis]|uniref:Uncharacterized protein n=1 Tax=Albula goreensis TaxID=1534307 RepID=A0A8T3DFB4_9TELE|nr:hypothetical protein AGOR_G00092140 [Albula goreensis]
MAEHENQSRGSTQREGQKVMDGRAGLGWQGQPLTVKLALLLRRKMSSLSALGLCNEWQWKPLPVDVCLEPHSPCSKDATALW